MKEANRVKFLIFIACLLGIWLIGDHLDIDIPGLQTSLARVPIYYSGLIYIVLYVVVSFFVWFSKDVLWLTAAIIFGPLKSALFICLAEIINAFVLFYLARALGRAYVARKLRQKYQVLDKKLERINFFWLFIFRAAPLIPYRFLDLAAGLTSIPFRRYLAAVVIGSPVKIIWIQYILYGLGKSIFARPYALVEYLLQHPALWALSGVCLLLVIAVVVKISAKERI
jgi:uncharacterized membrane protein YdjX (TVP38/TMEM64 family)